MKKVLVVDDSALMRKLLTGVLVEGGYEVRSARNGAEGVDMVVQWQPDVVTLDINMPEMDGLTALSLIMSARPTPVVMVSSLTEKGALATFEALALGAVDFIPKPGGTISLHVDDIKALLLD
jgi:two-component system chemotaxis response regulator CheB